MAVEATVLSLLGEQKQLLLAVVQSASAQQAQLAIANERLEQIIELLAPKEDEKSNGSSLAELLSELTQRIVQLTVLVRDVGEVVAQMPGEVANAIAEQQGAGLSPG